jgi:hypothetical protein
LKRRSPVLQRIPFDHKEELVVDNRLTAVERTEYQGTC